MTELPPNSVSPSDNGGGRGWSVRPSEAPQPPPAVERASPSFDQPPAPPPPPSFVPPATASSTPNRRASPGGRRLVAVVAGLALVASVSAAIFLTTRPSPTV